MRFLQRLILLSVLWLSAVSPASARVRIKDITDLEGAHPNKLVGVGLVVGLNATGSKNSLTQQVAVDMLQRFQISSKIIAQFPGDAVFKSGNISLVMVTAELGPFQRKGSRLDVTVSTLDDATSLQGGELIVTPLRGADNVVYALASGQVLVGGFSVGVPSGTSTPTAGVQKNHPTVGRISNGGVIECEARGEILCKGQVRLVLRSAEFGTARSIEGAINRRFPDTAVTLDAGSVQVFVPLEHLPNLVAFVGEIGQLEVDPDMPARVVIDERTGTVVAGENVKISSVAITQGNLSISTSNEPVAAQPLPFARGKTVVLPRGQVGVTEQGGVMQVLPRTMTVAELARALNALGASPRDMIIIFQHLRRIGALHAELIVM